MSYRQVKDFDVTKGGTGKYLCLRNVRLGYGIAPLYNTAWEAWGGTEQHKDRNFPNNVDVPLYYSFTATIDGIRKNWGHINVRMAGGGIWNDGAMYASLSDFERLHSNVDFVGWGESVNKVKVVEGEDMYQGRTAQEWHAKWAHANSEMNKARRERDQWKAKWAHANSEMNIARRKLTELWEKIKAAFNK